MGNGGPRSGVLGIPALLYVAFVGLPLVALVVRAMQRGNLLDALRLPLVQEAMKLSAVTSLLALAIAVAIGTPLAYLLARRAFPGWRMVDALVDLPLVLPPVVAGVALLMAFGRRGLLGGALHAAGIDIAFTTAAVVMAQTFVAAPLYVRTLKAGFEAVDPELEQIAYTLGVSRLGVFFRITLPLARPALLGGAVLCWARALSEFGATIMFAGNFMGRTQTLPLAILSALESDLFAALAIAVLLLAASAAVLALLRLAVREGAAGGA